MLVAEGGTVPGSPIDAFGVAKMAEPQSFLSLLYNLGMLTCAAGPAPALQVPNYVI